ncbi:MAG: hypothetical protein GX774_05865 [Armatimonadetes bacterium]|jgi:hypothetical protein|nr:hypothetical protein [Armatimonadota bacterium]
MKASSEFQRRNQRRTWTVILFLVALLLVALLSISYFAVMMATEGGASFMAQAQRLKECGHQRMLPLAAAAERYRRGEGKYPERIEDVFPVYLAEEQMLYCPLDTAGPDAKRSSFTYQPPEPDKPNVPLLECPHHDPLVLLVRPQGRMEPGHTLWVLHTKARARSTQ